MAIITKLFSLHEYESSWNKPLLQPYCRTAKFPVFRKYIPCRLKHKKPQLYWIFLCIVGWNMQVTKKTDSCWPHCFHSFEGVTKLTKPSIWFMYILLCQTALLFNSVFSISKSPHTYMSCSWSTLSFLSSKTFHIWSSAVNSKASYWHYMCILCFPHIILPCHRCRRMRTFVLWSEMCLLHLVLIGEILKPVIPNCSDKKSALLSLSPPQTPHGLLWVWTSAFMVTTY